MAESTNHLTEHERALFSRHLKLPEVGELGQQKLKSASVLVIGAGGLGSPVILYLSAAGVGRIGVVDSDHVQLTNLHRQVLYVQNELGCSKAQLATEKITAINPSVKVDKHAYRLDQSNVMAIVCNYDVIIDCTDNFSTRYLINDACVLSKKHNVYGAIHRFEGQVTVFEPGGACYRCLFPKPPQGSPNCAEAGVLGVLPGIVGTMQALECLKILLGIGDTLAGQLLLIDCLQMHFDRLNYKKDSGCTVCGIAPSIRDISEFDYSSVCLDGSTEKTETIEAEHLRRILEQATDEMVLLDVRSSEEYEAFHLQEALHIPVDELRERFEELPKNVELFVYCKSGVRSRKAAEILLASGFARVRTLTGGLDSYQALL